MVKINKSKNIEPNSAKIEKERDEMEKLYMEMKKNFENEQNKYIELDKIFYEYKKEHEKSESRDSDSDFDLLSNEESQKISKI